MSPTQNQSHRGWPTAQFGFGLQLSGFICVFLLLLPACDEAPALPEDPLEALEAADLARFDTLAEQAQVRSSEGIGAALEAGRFAQQIDSADAQSQARTLLEACSEWRELPEFCASFEGLSALLSQSDEAGQAALTYRAFVYGCEIEESAGTTAGAVLSNSRKQAIDEAATRTLVSRVRVLGTAENNNTLRVIVDVAGGVRGRPTFDEFVRPTRLTLALAHLTRGPDVPIRIPVQSGGLETIQVGAGTIVLELQPQTHAALTTFADPFRFVIDVQTGISTAQSDAAPLIVLDPGHGGRETGARYEELTESVLVLDLAERVAARLRQRIAGVRVVLTRDSDVELALEDRAARANALAADLFVSLHLNASNEPVATGGVTTFVLDTSDDIQARRLAARENGTRLHEVTGIQHLLAGLHRQTQQQASRRLAEAVQQTTWNAAHERLRRLPNRGVKSAMFYVLVGARMPAILIESSFLTVPREAEALREESHRQRIAEGIAEGIERYLRAEETRSAAEE